MMYQVFVALVCVCVGLPVREAVEIPPQWQAYIQQLLERCQVPLSTIVSPPTPHDQILHTQTIECPLDLAHYILPSVLLWNLIEQFVMAFGDKPTCIKENCEGTLALQCWKMGQTHSLQPRILHTCECTVLLVAALYSCSCGHEISSTDPNILSKLSEEHIPFVLMHRTGFLKEFVNSVIELVVQGMTLAGVERFVQRRRQQFITSLVLQVQVVLDGSHAIDMNNLRQNTAVKLISEPTPSNNIIQQCFLVDFFENREAYNLYMSLLPIKKFISLDHTFKIASNIGFVQSDGKLVTLYNSVFIALNEVGQVVSWQFTRTTSLDEVKTQLENLCTRMMQTCSLPFTILVDACCSMRQKLQQTFGKDAVVSLDIFHAVQRFTRKLPKRHPLFMECMNDFKMVFRAPTDIGIKRKQSTPCPSVTMERLDDFITKWSRCEIHDWKILNDPALKEISCLKVHIRKGCLANINPSAGTNRNENLHRHMNPHFANRSRIGLPFALALVTILLFQHNRSIEEKLTGRVLPTIKLWRYQCGAANSPEVFGIQKKDVNQHGISWIASPVIDITSLSPISLRQACLSTTLDADVSDVISIEDVIKIVENAIYLSKVAVCMQKQSSQSPAFNYRFLPLMSSVASIFFHHNPEPEPDEHSRSEKRLDNVLKAWGMKRHYIEGDGNCSFSSVAFSLLTNSTLILENSPDFFTNIGINPSDNLKSLSKQLRNLTVAEWIQNPEDYEGFVPEVDIQQEAAKFLQSGYFYGELADTIVLALSNLLGLPFIIFSSSICQPVITITPRHLKAPIPIYLAFNQSGAGHYDSAVLCNTEHIKPSAIPPGAIDADGPCSCGKNDKMNKSHCHPTVSKYTTVVQCRCYKKNKPCTDSCRCKTCNNPFGRKLQDVFPQVSRKRPRQQWQMSVPKSVKFAVNAGEDIATGSRSMLEFFVLESILKHCARNGIDITPINVGKVFNTIVEISDTLDTNIQIGEKPADSIECFLREHSHIVETFKALCLAQVQNECSNSK